MKHLLQHLVLVSAGVLAFAACEDDEKDGDTASNGALVWVRNIDDADTSTLSVATDTAANTFVLTVFSGVASIDDNELGTAGVHNLVLIKYAPTGVTLFTKLFVGTFSNQTEVHVATDDDDDVMIVLHNPLGTITLDEERAGAVLSKLSGSDGDPLYSVPLDGVDEERHVRGLVVDPDGDILLLGNTQLVVEQIAGPARMWAAKLRGTDGLERFSTTYGDDDSHVEGVYLASTTTGDLLVSGVFGGVFAMDGESVATADRSNFFVARLSDDDGAVMWALPLDGPAEATPLALAAGPSDEVVLTGNFTFPLDLTDDNIQAGSITVAKLDGTQDGDLVWRSYILGTEEPLIPGAVAVDAKGDVVLSVGFSGTLTLKGVTWNSAGKTSMAVSKWSADKGQLTWARSASGAGNTRPVGLTLDNDANIVASGILSKIDAEDVVTRELFVMKLTP